MAVATWRQQIRRKNRYCSRCPKEQRNGAGLSKARLDYRISQARVDLGIDALDDLWRDAPSNHKSIPTSNLKSRNRVSNSRHIWQVLQSACACHRQRAQGARPEVRKRCRQRVEHNLDLTAHYQELPWRGRSTRRQFSQAVLDLPSTQTESRQDPQPASDRAIARRVAIERALH
jgi:hypothetical protein